MDANERQLVLDGLVSSRVHMLEATAGLTPEQWHYQPEEGHWSAAHCLEHVALTENRILRAIGKMLTRPPASEEEKAAVAAKDSKVLEMIPNRTKPFQAPEMVRPKSTWPETSDLLAEFEAARARSIEFATATDADLRSHIFPHIVLQDLDCYQWLLVLGAHCDRHASQIEAVKATPGFPKA